MFVKKSQQSDKFFIAHGVAIRSLHFIINQFILKQIFVLIIRIYNPQS